MPRDVDSATLALLENETFSMCHLVSIDFTSSIFITDASYPVNYAGETYQPASHLLSIGSPSESQELRVGSISIGLSGVNQQYVSIFLNQNHVNRRVQIFLAILDTAGNVVGDAIKTYDGQIESFSLTEGNGTSAITMRVASHWADFERKTGRMTNQNSQQYYFPNDTGMQFAAESIKDIKWGRA